MSLYPANHDSPSGAARFMLAAVVSGFLLLFLCLLMPITISQIARVVPPLVMMPAILLMASCVLWLQAYFLPMLSPQRNVRRRISEPVYNAIGEEMRAMRRNPYGRTPRELTRLQQACLLGASFILACVVWLFIVSALLQPRMQDYMWDKGRDRPRSLAKAQLALWTDAAARTRHMSHLRRKSPELEFTTRTFVVLAMANVALRDVVLKPTALSIIDTIITETLEQERKHGQEVFFTLGPLTRRVDFINSSRRSVFVDGGLAMMLGARRLVEEHTPWREEMQQRIRFVAQELRDGPLLCAESYPNECRMTSNAVAMATLRMSDALDGTDYSGFIDAWVGRARTFLVDRKADMLFSRFDFTGKPQVLEGPEGVSIWTTVHFLEVVDHVFAQSQYNAAVKQLQGNFLGFGYARKRPVVWDDPPTAAQLQEAADEDVPIVHASPDSSGRALIAALTFADIRWQRQLITSLEFFGFPTLKDGHLSYISSNGTGDAVILYAFVQGPLWDKVRSLRPPPAPYKPAPAPSPATPTPAPAPTNPGTPAPMPSSTAAAIFPFPAPAPSHLFP